MSINRVAFLGCGPAGSCFVHGLRRNLPAHLQLDVHLLDDRSVARATERLAALGSKLGDEGRPRINLTLDRTVAPEADLIVLQLPRQPGGVSFKEQNEQPSKSDQQLVIGRFLETQRSDAQILRYTTSFCPKDRVYQQGGVGLIHYSNPSHLLPLLEIAPPTGDQSGVDKLRSFFRGAGYFPLVLPNWQPGFFSIRFQVRLLVAVEKIFRRMPKTTPSEIDSVIRQVVQSLLALYRAAGPESALLEPLRLSVMETFAQIPSFLPLWNALVVTWRELQPGLRDWEIATALFGGPALRCLQPGFLSTIDIEGIPAFCGLLDKIFPKIQALKLEELIGQGRVGGVGAGDIPHNGFYNWTVAHRRTALRERDECLAANAISLAD